METAGPAKRHERIVHARKLRRDMTEPERRLWWHLRRIRSGQLHFRRQSPIGPYFADFACHQKRLAVEIDGETHAAPAVSTRDDLRTSYFRSQGYRVLRFWNDDVMNNIEGVMEAIRQACAMPWEGPPPLTPPHASRGRGTP